MNAVLTMYRSTIGKKVAMGVTGAMMVGWLLAHMAGNLQVFIGPTAFNHYAAMLQGQQELLWVVRFVMLGALVVHVASIVQLATMGSRKTGYAGGRKTQVSTMAARTLRLGGLVVLLFLVFHLADLTIGVPAVTTLMDQDPKIQFGHCHAVAHGLECVAYENLVQSLRRPVVAALYIVANLALAAHIYHGVYSVFQTLGINQPGHTQTARQVATGLAVLIGGGNILIALAIVTRLIGA